VTLDRRTRIRRTSSRRALARSHYEQVKATVFQRDGRCRLAGSLLGPCLGRLTPHHLWKSGQGGPDHPCNIITLCEFHNGLVEDMDRADAEALGLVVPWGGTIAQAWRRLLFAGLVTYWFDGRHPYQSEPDEPGSPYERIRT